MEGYLCIATDMGLSKFKLDGKNEINLYKNYNIWDGLASNKINSLCADSAAGVWIGTDNGLTYLTKIGIRNYKTVDGLSQNLITSLALGRYGELWIGTMNGFDRLKKGSFDHFMINRTPDKNKAECMLVDHENNLWIGTYGDGLNRFTGEGFKSYNEQDGLENTFVFPIRADGNGNMWVGTDAAGLFRFSGGRFYRFSVKEGLPSNKVNDILPYEDNKLWVATDNALCLLNISSKTPVLAETLRFGESLNEPANCLARDGDKLWIGSHNGVYAYDISRNSFTRYQLNALVKDFDVWYLHVDRHGQLWAGAYLGGLFRFNGHEFVEAGSKMGMNTDTYLSILEDKSGNLYFGTFDGLYIYDAKKGKTSHIAEEDGLSSELIYAMQFDENERFIWLGTNQGLNRLDLNSYYKHNVKAITTYGREDGFTGAECNSNGAFRDESGLLWWGTVNGLISCNPSKLKNNLAEPQTNIVSVSVMNRDTLMEQGGNLHYDQNDIVIAFNGISLSDPAKVKCSYTLGGFDKTWSAPAASNLASYSNLPPGKYDFKVIATNGNGVWNKKPAVFSFTISPPFWQTWWFLGGLLLFAALLTERLIRHYIRTIKLRERRRYHQKIKLALTELRALRAQMNPHFIFNSLNSIQHFILTRDSESASHYLNKFARLMRTILNNSERSSVTLQEELDSIKLYLELEIMRFENKFEYRLSLGEGLDPAIVEIPPMIIQPYLENAIIHGIVPNPDKGLLEINIQLQNKLLLCTITDNGIGRKEALARRNKAKSHRSMGMKLTRDSLEVLSHVHNSQLSLSITDLESPEGEALGTRVELFIPVS